MQPPLHTILRRNWTERRQSYGWQNNNATISTRYTHSSTKYFKTDSISVDSYYNEYLAGETNPIKYREYYFVVDLGANYDFDTSVYYYNGGSTVADKLGNVIKTSIQSKLDTNYLVSINETKNVSDDFNNKDVAIQYIKSKGGR